MDTTSITETGWAFIGTGVGILLYCGMALAKYFADHEACAVQEEPDETVEIAKPKPSTVQRCKNPECGRMVSYRKITGDYCAYCHIDITPAPKSPEPKETKVAIAAEVLNHE